jgi:hypothetical protein
VLFRPDADGLRTLADGGSFSVWRVVAGKPVLLATSKPGTKVSLLLGTNQPISPLLLDSWRMELTAKELTPDMIANRLLQWKNPYWVQSSAQLEPQMVLVAEIQTRDDIPMTRTQVTLGDDKLTDVAMETASTSPAGSSTPLPATNISLEGAKGGPK